MNRALPLRSTRRRGPRRARQASFRDGVADLRPMPSDVIQQVVRSGPCARYRPAIGKCLAEDAGRCSCLAAGHRRCSASTCAAAAASPSTSSRSATRPTSSTTAGSGSPTATSGSSTGSRRDPDGGRARRSRTPAPTASSWSAGASAGSCRCSRSPTAALPVASVGARREPVRLHAGAADGAVRPLAELTGGALGTALYRALGGAPSPLVRRRLPARPRSTAT